MSWLDPSRCILIAVALAALAFGYFAWADYIGDVREAEIHADYKVQADIADAERAAIAAPIEAKQQAAQAHIRTVTKTIVKEVKVYVKDTDCPMPSGFRVYHDAAANGKVPDATGIADAAPSTTADVASTIAQNYGTYHEIAARLSGLQDWVRSQQEVK